MKVEKYGGKRCRTVTFCKEFVAKSVGCPVKPDRTRTLDAVPLLICSLVDVVFDVSFARSIARWREANGGLLGVHEPRDLDDRALRGFEVGELGESEYARHLRAQLLWRGDDAQLVSIFGDVFGPIHLDVVQFLGELRQQGWHLVGVITTNPWHEQIWRDVYEDVLHVFDQVFTSTALGLRPPDHRFYVEVLRRFCAGARPGTASSGLRLFVDARPENISAARSAGLDAHLFRGVPGLSSACQVLATPAL